MSAIGIADSKIRINAKRKEYVKRKIKLKKFIKGTWKANLYILK